MKPLAVDLCAGLGGWTDGLLVEGWDVVGFDIERHQYGAHKYPSQLVLQDIRTINGRQFKGKISLIVASPPCQKYSYMAMPWSKAKALAAWYRDQEHPERIVELNELFNACQRIAKEAECPIVIENVRGAQPWVGRAKWMFGSFALWGDVPALMPVTTSRRAMKQGITHRPDGSTNFHGRKNSGGSWFNIGGPGQKETGKNPVHELAGMKGIPHRPIGHWTNPEENGTKQGGDWFNNSQPSISRLTGSKSPARKAASAMIAKIPLVLARHIARCWKPRIEAGQWG